MLDETFVVWYVDVSSSFYNTFVSGLWIMKQIIFDFLCICKQSGKHFLWHSITELIVFSKMDEVVYSEINCNRRNYRVPS